MEYTVGLGGSPLFGGSGKVEGKEEGDGGGVCVPHQGIQYLGGQPTMTAQFPRETLLSTDSPTKPRSLDTASPRTPVSAGPVETTPTELGKGCG